MKLLHKTSTIPFYLVHTGFQSFKRRLREILCATSGLTLEDYVDDETLGVLYETLGGLIFQRVKLSDIPEVK